MKTIERVLCILAVLLTAVCVHADTITYDFDDGTFQGWTHDERATLEWHVWDTAADDNGGVFISHTGDYALRIQDWGIRDNNTDLLMITSPEFKISDGATVEFWGLGGMGAVERPTWTNYADVPTVATSGGFMGIALRRVSDGEYVLFGRRDISSESDNDPSWTAIEWNAAEIASAVASDSSSERYVIDVIDTYTGGWGWFGFDEVILTNVKAIGDTVADNPSPDDGAEDVVPAPTLQWTVGEYAETHDIYFGTNFDDVNEATTDSDLYMGRQSGTEFVPGELELGQTYYWRVDEVNGAPDYAIYKGDTWSFTVEPFAYAVENVVATSNTEYTAETGPENLVDGSGLNENDEHATNTDTMWLGTPVDGDTPYVQFELDRVYKLHEMLVWNYNMDFEFLLGFGVKETTVEYSIDGVEWTVLSDVELAQGTSQATYTANSAIAFEGVAVKFVRLTINSSWTSTASHGLSEVRFMYIPAHAREPQPEDGTTDVQIDTELTWRPGRDAVAHEIYLSTDPNAPALAGTPNQSSFSAALDLDTTYYWRVDETHADATWEGNLWSFTTQEYITIDDFEAYVDDETLGVAIWIAWVDGLVAFGGDATNGGSQIGHDVSPFAEQDIVRTGSQSMPLYFDNAGASDISETDYTFASAQDWTANGIKSLSLWFHGAAGNTGQLYVKINDTKVLYDGDASDIARPQWLPWNIDLTAVASAGNVTTLSIGIEGAGSGVLYIDDVRLYAKTPQYDVPTDPAGVGLVAQYSFENNADDTSGNANHGTLEGGPQFATGHTGRALDCDGVDDYIYTGKSASDLGIGGNAPRTVSVWVYTRSFANGGIFDLGDRSATEDFCLRTYNSESDTWRIQYWGGDYDFTYPTENQWVHFAHIHDGQRTKIYANGTLIVDWEKTINTTDTNPLQIGCYGWQNNFFDGLIDELQVYNRALSGGEIVYLAGQTMPRHVEF